MTNIDSFDKVAVKDELLLAETAIARQAEESIILHVDRELARKRLFWRSMVPPMVDWDVVFISESTLSELSRIYCLAADEIFSIMQHTIEMSDLPIQIRLKTVQRFQSGRTDRTFPYISIERK